MILTKVKAPISLPKLLKKFNQLTFLNEVAPRLRYSGNKIRRRRRALFQCECGNISEYDLSDVVTGHTKRCLQCGIKKAAAAKITHNKIKHPLYRKWQDMKNRCYNKKVDHYKDYGGRKVIVCDEWKNNFSSFYDWCIANGWRKELELDRKNVNGNYDPGNCRFVTHIEQGYNKTNTRYVTYNNESICLAQLLHRLNLSEYYKRIHTQIVKKNGNPDLIINSFINV